MRTRRFVLSAVVLASLLSSATAPVHAQPTVAIETLAGNVSQAIAVTAAHDGSGRLFAVQQTGEIRVWTGGADFETTPFLDISTILVSGSEQGLLGLAFHPDYASNGFFYVNYTDLGGDTVVARYQVSGDPNVADSGSHYPILSFVQEATNHNGGDLHFGPDGYLYISSGDGGANWDNSQDTTNLLGKLLRIDVDADAFPADPDRNYTIPADNPLVGQMGAAQEIWHLGLRNPWRFSFDRSTGDLFIGDVGEGEWEEVDFAAPNSAGTNWGWPCYEGHEEFQTSGCLGIGSYDFPILVLEHDPPDQNNCSVIGGYRYHGTESPAFSNWYFFTDWCTGVLWAAEENGGGSWTAHDVGDLGTFSVTGFGETEGGELVAAGGWRIVRIFDPTNAIFADGFESGDTTAW